MSSIKFLDNALEEYSSNTLLFDYLGNSCSYQDVATLSTGSFICTQRELTICCLDNTIQSLSGYLAIMQANSVAMLVSRNISPSQLLKLASLYKPKYLWVSTDYDASALSISASTEILEGYTLHQFSEHTTNLNDNLSLLLGTSGSTGSQKFVRLSHANISSNAKSISRYLQITSTDIPITTLPPQYTYGLSIIHSHIVKGASVAVTNKTFFDHEFWAFLNESSSTTFGGVPYHYEILRKLHFHKKTLPNLSVLTQAGGKMDISLTKYLLDYCTENQIRFFTMYGQTEATARMSYLPPEDSYSKLGSIGLPIPGGSFWLEDSNGSIITESNIVGELIYKGPNVSMGYANNCADLACSDHNNTILRTGDLAFVDSEGYYFIKGRQSRFIKLFGNRINPVDIEHYLAGSGYTSICTGQDDKLEIYILYRQSYTSSTHYTIKNLVSDFIKVSPTCLTTYFILDFPRTESGKLKLVDISPDLAMNI